MFVMPVAIIIIITGLVVMKGAKKRHRITRENSVAMEALLFCFVFQRYISAGKGRRSASVSTGKSKVDNDIPRLSKYEHLIPKRNGCNYTINNWGRSVPAVIVNINGETRLVAGRRNSRLRTEDLGKMVNILFQESGYAGMSTFIINDEQSLAEEWGNSN